MNETRTDTSDSGRFDYGPQRPWYRKPLWRGVHWLWTPVAFTASVGLFALQVWVWFARPILGAVFGWQ